METVFYAVIVPFLCGISGVALSLLLFRWDSRRFQLDLDYRLSDLEGRVNREVKIRANEASRKDRSIEKELLAQIESQTPKPKMDLQSWTNDKYKV